MRTEIKKYSDGLLDFHNHSTYSDGSDTPYELVQRAKRHGVSAMALTDHHSHKGLLEFRTACEEAGILGIPFGVEIGIKLPDDVLTPKDNHTPDMIVLGKNPKEEPMRDYRKLFFDFVKREHIPDTLEILEHLGFAIPSFDMDAECAKCHCPPDILYSFIHHGDNMRTLIDYVTSKNPEASPKEISSNPVRFINRYLYAVGCPAYTIKVNGFSVDDALKLVDAMNCRLFIAHPGGEYGELSDKILNYFIEKGVKGIEARNYFNNPRQNAKFDRLAKIHSLVRSGGSDCHGDKGLFKIGMHDRPHNQLPKEILEELWDNLPN